MNAANSGAVFFLGTRAHYQVLTPPESHDFDLNNSNTSTETIYQNQSAGDRNIWPIDQLESPGSREMDESGNFIAATKWSSDTVIDMKEKNIDFEYGTGVKRRLKKKRKQGGSSELILNDNDELSDIDPAALNNNDLSEEEKKPTKFSRVSVACLRSMLGRRKRSADMDPLIVDNLTGCTLRDSCRCIDCQGSYFDVDEDDDSYDEFLYPDCDEISRQFEKLMASEPVYDDDPEPMMVTESGELDSDDDDGDDDDEVFIDSPPVQATSTIIIECHPPQASELEADEHDLEMAAGWPWLFNHLLSHPIACSIQ